MRVGGVPRGFEMIWDEIAPSRPTTAQSVRWYHRLAARVVPPMVVGAVLLWLQHAGLAIAVLAVGTVVGIASAVAPRLDLLIGRIIHSVGRFVGRSLTIVLLGLVSLVVLLPVAVIAAITHRHPEEGVAADGGWRVRPNRPTGLPRRLYARESFTLDHRAGWRLVVEAFGWLTVIVLVDLAAGWVWSNTLTPYDAAARAAATPADARVSQDADPASTAAMQGSPWAPAYFEALESVDYDFVPFLTWRAKDLESPYINITDGIRRSYEPAGLGPDTPTVWFFGGSTTWGEGQRDRHTIPSEVARLSERAGTPVRVINFAQRGFVLWQEMLDFEQALAVREPPDLAVFYDGMNEINTQLEQGQPGQPTVFNADTYEARLRSTAVAVRPDGQPVDNLSEAVWLWWREHSALARLTERVGAAFAVAPRPHKTAPFTEDELQEVVPEAVDVYVRARDVLLDIAARHDVETLLTWQADRQAAQEVLLTNALERAADLVGPPTVDLTAALDGVDPDALFIDGGHTNERGAQLVAEALWPLIEEALDTQDGGGP